MISIICPTYNSSRTIANVIDSILSQKEYKHNFEIIFIDDGSIDDTVNIIRQGIKELIEKNIDAQLYINSHNGPGASRNIGIKKSKYNYIAFIDSDDIWYENKISLCEEAISNNPMNNIFIHDELFVRTNYANSKIINGNYTEPLSESLYNKNCFSTSAVIIDKELLQKYGGFDEKLMSSQDYELWLKLSNHLNPYKIDKVLGEYRELPGSITSKFYLYRFLDQLYIACRYKQYVPAYKYYLKILKIIISKQWFYGIKNFILRKETHNY